MGDIRELNWSHSVTSKVGGHMDKLLREGGSFLPSESIVAQSTNGLPVYADMSGSLAFTPKGSLVFYDWETNQVTEVTDVKWRTRAAVSAIERYPDLQEMMPERPESAKSCVICFGSGRVFENKVVCGTCDGLGWI